MFGWLKNESRGVFWLVWAGIATHDRLAHNSSESRYANSVNACNGTLTMAEMSDRKKRIMEHLARSSGEFIKRSTSTTSEDRKKQIQDHIRLSKGTA